MKVTENVKKVMRKNAGILISILLDEKVPFRLVIWNNDNWDAPLPDDIMKNFSQQLILDIKDQSLEDSYFDEDNNIISTYFHGKEYTKTLLNEEILGILDLSGQPLQLNSFKQTKQGTETEKFTSKQQLLNSVVNSGINEEDAKRSLDMFFKNNPKLKEELK